MVSLLMRAGVMASSAPNRAWGFGVEPDTHPTAYGYPPEESQEQAPDDRVASGNPPLTPSRQAKPLDLLFCS